MTETTTEVRVSDAHRAQMYRAAADAVNSHSHDTTGGARYNRKKQAAKAHTAAIEAIADMDPDYTSDGGLSDALYNEFDEIYSALRFNREWDTTFRKTFTHLAEEFKERADG